MQTTCLFLFEPMVFGLAAEYATCKATIDKKDKHVALPTKPWASPQLGRIAKQTKTVYSTRTRTHCGLSPAKHIRHKCPRLTQDISGTSNFDSLAAALLCLLYSLLLRRLWSLLLFLPM